MLWYRSWSNLLKILKYLVTTVLSSIRLISKFLSQLWKLEIWSQYIQILKGNVKEEPKNLKESRFSLEMGFQNWVAVKSSAHMAQWSKCIVTAIFTYSFSKGREKMRRHLKMFCTLCESQSWLWLRPVWQVGIFTVLGEALAFENIIVLSLLLSCHFTAKMVAIQWLCVAACEGNPNYY